MLGEKIGESNGKVTGRRLLPFESGDPRLEVSTESKGTLLGVKVQELDTYETSLDAQGRLLGHGQGLVIGSAGEQARWTGQGVGQLNEDGRCTYRGSLCFRTTAPAWSRLNAVAVVFEYEEDAEGNTRSQIWEWR